MKHRSEGATRYSFLLVVAGILPSCGEERLAAMALPASSSRGIVGLTGSPEAILGSPLMLDGEVVPWATVRRVLCLSTKAKENFERAMSDDHEDVDDRVRAVWAQLLPDLVPADVRAAKLWLAKTMLLRRELEKARSWLSEREAENAYRARSDPYKDSDYSIELIALKIERFPSLEHYREYHRIYESFKRMKAGEMTETALEKHARSRTDMILTQGTIDVDVILCSAYDFDTNRWKTDGWEGARHRMDEVLELRTEGIPWDELVGRYSEFPDGPDPMLPLSSDRPGKRGCFRAVQRNPLLHELGESEYGLFLYGSSVTDRVFFEQRVGEQARPIRGPLGWYLPLLLRRSSPSEVSLPSHDLEELVRQDYLNCQLNAYAQRVLESSRVLGLDD